MTGNRYASIGLVSLLSAFAVPGPNAAMTTASAKCTADGSALTLQENGRFRIQVRRDAGGNVVPECLTSTSGAFSFVSPGNFDVVVKVLDTREAYGAFGIFYAGLTDAAYTVEIYDQVTWRRKTYKHAAGDFSGFSDFRTFKAPRAGTSTSDSVQVASPTSDLVAEFTFKPQIPGVEQEITLSDRSAGGPTQRCWFFGDEGCQVAPDCSVSCTACQGKTQDVKHAYGKAGIYRVALQVARGNSDGTTLVRSTCGEIEVKSCSFEIVPLNPELGPERRNGFPVTVIASSSLCGWEVSDPNPADFLATSARGIHRDTGSFLVTVEKNNTSRERVGDLLVAGQPWRVTQKANPLAPCVPDGTTLCLLDGRFEVRVNFPRRSDGKAVRTAPGSNSGYFWLFDKENVELAVKMVNGTAVNHRYWIFLAGLTDLEYMVQVRDSLTGSIRRYKNRAGRLASVWDTQAFADRK